MFVEKKVKRTPWFAVVLISALSILNLLLIRQNFSLVADFTLAALSYSESIPQNNSSYRP
jgi:hypothetical protein